MTDAERGVVSKEQLIRVWTLDVDGCLFMVEIEAEAVEAWLDLEYEQGIQTTLYPPPPQRKPPHDRRAG